MVHAHYSIIEGKVTTSVKLTREVDIGLLFFAP